MPFGQLVIGSPGAGKTTYCDGLHQFLTALGRPISIVNLDPANGKRLPYECAINIADLITVKDVMNEEGLGPNGAMLYCIEYLEENFDWLEKRLDALGDDAYVAFDLPGQVELSTNHGSLRRILERLQKRDWRLVAVHLLDASHITDASRYVSLLLLSLRAMLTLELPHINVLSKVDLLGDAAAQVRRRNPGSIGSDDESDDDADSEATDEEKDNTLAPQGGLPFKLDFYTDVQNLDYLVDHLNSSMGPRRTAKFAELNEKICEMIEEFGLVQFETLAVEDKRSMIRLQHILDKATGYVYIEHPNSKSSTQNNGAEGLRDVSLPSQEDPSLAAYEPGSRRGTAASAAALFSVADRGAPTGWESALDVHERWLDHREEWDEIEEKERLELQQRWQERQAQEAKQSEAFEKEAINLKPIKERS
ncbi:uncharacterized protein FA14DRAFT_169066 [Meira miltonrushii]|uniref:GPN-loop GTPase 2 n=1 Tax=Meira miltonrushii TaxID=1280837 RepID=A0A316V3R0_9BASI|nr:uncharacterized protein FA14DRAFT_169066 [Meira miltonrushii]PWN32186.1 hypothetical protein FA14DRAFT_169066 [Meira miltonrushii]